MILIQKDMRARAVSGGVAVGAPTATTVPCRSVAAAARTTVAAMSGFVWQEVFKVFEFLEFGVWDSFEPRSE